MTAKRVNCGRMNFFKKRLYVNLSPGLEGMWIAKIQIAEVLIIESNRYASTPSRLNRGGLLSGYLPSA
jgi:hypothetical protein